MFPAKCRAILKNSDDEILEYGTATVQLRERTADFRNSFVPIYKIGTELKIVCIESNKITHIISGKVFLSSPKLMRIVSINCTLLPEAEKLLGIDVCFSAEIYQPSIKKNFFTSQVINQWEACTVLYISAKEITFRSSQILEDFDRNIIIRIHNPVFSKLTEIPLLLGGNNLLFGENAKYNYCISAIGKNEKEELEGFIRQACLDALGDSLK